MLIITDPMKSVVKKEWFGESHAMFTMPLKFNKVRLKLRKMLGIEVSENS